MLLDRWLMQRDPWRLETYYSAFTAEAIGLACEQTTSDAASSEALRGILEVFVQSAFLRDYVRAEGLAQRFLRTVGRTSFAAAPPPVGRIATLVEEVSEPMAAGSRELLEAVRMA